MALADSSGPSWSVSTMVAATNTKTMINDGSSLQIIHYLFEPIRNWSTRKENGRKKRQEKRDKVKKITFY